MRGFMAMIDLHLSLPAEIVEEVGALAEQLGQPRSDLMLRALQLGLEQTAVAKGTPSECTLTVVVASRPLLSRRPGDAVAIPRRLSRRGGTSCTG